MQAIPGKSTFEGNLSGKYTSKNKGNRMPGSRKPLGVHRVRLGGVGGGFPLTPTASSASLPTSSTLKDVTCTDLN